MAPSIASDTDLDLDEFDEAFEKLILSEKNDEK